MDLAFWKELDQVVGVLAERMQPMTYAHLCTIPDVSGNGMQTMPPCHPDYGMALTLVWPLLHFCATCLLALGRSNEHGSVESIL